jgi:hypothetical protein
VLTSSMLVATLLLSSNEHDDVTMPIAIVPIYKEIYIILLSSLGRAQCKSRLYVRMVAIFFEKRGGCFDFIFLGINSRS